jgi:predicted dehydrogenase
VHLLDQGKLDVSLLISHRFPIEDAPQAYSLITGKTGEPFLGVLLTYPQDPEIDLKASKTEYLGSREKKLTSGQVNLGVLGAGNFAGAVMLPALKSIRSINQIGIASASGLSAQHAAKKYGFGYASSDTEAILNDSNINTVAILTRHNLHAAQIVAALHAGKHVFCEKPLALNEEELDEIAAELEKPDSPLLMVGFNRRFAPMAVEMKAFFKNRQEPIAAHYRVNAGFLPPEHWLHDVEQGGGRIIGEGCHFVDFLTWLVGKPPVSVAAHGLPDMGRYLEDNLVMTFQFPDGSIGTVAYLANGDKSLPKERVEVFSGGRVAILDDYRKLTTIRNGRRKVRRSRMRQDKGHKAEWQAFVEAITRSGEPPIPYDQLLGVSRATFAAVDALRSGGRKNIGQ